ncbi:UDP-N-acetylmuramate dehydrogenase [Candidatus Uhrbacteria bacterium]|jgi:UDP-N-acetylmuramate dehydrogenase|nr:UDP-N-acetylmuramate dehydrogenase [Candidatus Uhrbacteria bacterium]
MNTELTAKLESIVSKDLKIDEPMSGHSHYKIGGPAKYFATAQTSEEVVELVRTAIVHEIDWVIVGAGTNILVSDAGFTGLVIKMANRSIQINEESGEVVAEAGALSAMVARETSKLGLTGFEWAVGLPGTIGGAVRGNAGCFGGEAKDSLESIDIVDGETGELSSIPAKKLKMGYRESEVKRKPWIVLRAHFMLEKRDAERNLEKLEDVLQCRAASQPKNARCAGCAYKNFEFSDVSDIDKLVEAIGIDNIPPNFINNKRIPAGWVIDQAGLKGFKVGGASISDVHGNFVINGEGATADHIVQLLAAVKTKVRNLYGVQLEEEIQLIGF